MRNQGNIEFETLEKQCWSYLRDIKIAISYFFYKRFAHNLPTYISQKKNLAEHWDLLNIIPKMPPLIWILLSLFLKAPFHVVFLVLGKIKPSK
jgi:hypothetical protein